MVDTSVSAPLLRVSRPVSACSRCRSAKVKCDGKLPACTACERAGKAQECTGGSDLFARGKERSYVASLESKLEKLEKKLAALDGREAARITLDGLATESETGSQNENPANGTPPPDERNSRRISKKNKQEDDGEIEELVADLGFLAINAVTRDFYGFANNISFGRVALRASSVSGSLDSKPRARLPPRHTATQLIQHYFDKIYATLPCLNEANFFGAVDSVYCNEASATQFDRFCVYMVLAVGTMSLSRSQDSSAAHNAACFVKVALDHTDAVISPSDIKGVQATLLLVQYSMLEPAHFNSWYLIGVASRIMIDIGLHQEPLKTCKRNTRMDLRRQVFYCVYTLDRSISMVLQRPFTFADDSIIVELPKIETSLSANLTTPGTLTPISTAVHLFKLRKLQSDWYQNLHLSGNEPLQDPDDYIRSQTDKLSRWREEIPSTISTSTRDWLLLEWHYLHVYVAAPCPKIPQVSSDAMHQIFTHCAFYAIAFRTILRDSNNTRFVYTYHDALRTYFVGSNLLHALYHSEATILPESAPEKDFDRAVRAIRGIVFVLTSMMIRWPDAEALRDKFRDESGPVLARLKRRLDAFAVADKERRLLKHQMSAEWPTAAPAAPAHQQLPRGGMMSRALHGGTTGTRFAISGHIATADFGNVAFYRSP